MSGTDATRREHFRGDIEGLRAISVIGVILFHLRLGPVSGGFAGVDVFFVISGFLITSLLLREMEATNRIDLLAFWARRARRLLPNAFLVLALVLLATALLTPFFRWHSVATDVKAALLFHANFHFAEKTVDYFFAHEQPSPVLHFWSLSVEEQYYFIWPVIALAVLALAPGRRHLVLCAVIAAVVALSFAANVLTVATHQPQAFFGLFSRAWQIGVGGLLAVGLAHGSGIGSRISQPWYAGVLGWAGLALIAFCFWLLDETLQYPGWWALLPVLGASLLIISGSVAGQRTLLARILSVAPMRWVGARSYSLYLWHWPLIAFFGPYFDSSHGKLVLLVLIVSCAVLAYQFVENPVRQGGGLSRGAVPTLAVFGGAAALLATVAVGLSKVPAQVLHVDALRAEAVGKAQADRGGAYDLQCHLAFDDEVTPPHCNFPAPAGSRRVALFGDSHAAQWFDPLRVAADEAGWAISSMTKSGCPAMAVTMYFPQRRSVFHPCDRWRESVMTSLTGPDKPDLVIIASRWTYSGWVYDKARGSVLHGEAAYRVLNAGLLTTVRRLQAAGVQVAFIMDTPTIDARFADCIAYGRDPDCGRARTVALPTPPIEGPAIAELGPSIRVIDVNDEICDKTQCPSLRGGQVLFRDPDHLTAAFARTFAPRFRELLP